MNKSFQGRKLPSKFQKSKEFLENGKLWQQSLAENPYLAPEKEMPYVGTSLNNRHLQQISLNKSFHHQSP